MKFLAAFAVAALLAQDPPKQDPPKAPPAPAPAPAPAAPKVATEKEADEAVALFKKEVVADLPSAKVAAIQKLAQVKHEKCAKAIVPYLGHVSDDVAGAAAIALGTIDHPASAEALARVVEQVVKRPAYFAAICDSMKKLRYEICAAPLNSLTSKHGDDDVIVVMEEILSALSAIGSPTSVEPLIDLRRATEHTGGGGRGGFGGGRGGRGAGRGGGRDGDLVSLHRPIDRALASITGLTVQDDQRGDGVTVSNLWNQAWKASKADLLANATATWIHKQTWVRQDGALKPKPSPDHLLVGVRLTPYTEPAPRGGGRMPPPEGGGDGK